MRRFGRASTPQANGLTWNFCSAHLLELKAEPLILSMPIDAYAARGVSHSTRELYYDKMRELSARYHFPVIEFEQHDADRRFLIPHREHPTPRGWMVYDRALDDFFRKSK